MSQILSATGNFLFELVDKCLPVNTHVIVGCNEQEKQYATTEIIVYLTDHHTIPQVERRPATTVIDIPSYAIKHVTMYQLNDILQGGITHIPYIPKALQTLL